MRFLRWWLVSTEAYGTESIYLFCIIGGIHCWSWNDHCWGFRRFRYPCHRFVHFCFKARSIWHLCSFLSNIFWSNTKSALEKIGWTHGLYCPSHCVYGQCIRKCLKIMEQAPHCLSIKCFIATTNIWARIHNPVYNGFASCHFHGSDAGHQRLNPVCLCVDSSLFHYSVANQKSNWWSHHYVQCEAQQRSHVNPV